MGSPAPAQKPTSTRPSRARRRRNSPLASHEGDNPLPEPPSNSHHCCKSGRSIREPVPSMPASMNTPMTPILPMTPMQSLDPLAKGTTPSRNHPPKPAIAAFHRLRYDLNGRNEGRERTGTGAESAYRMMSVLASSSDSRRQRWSFTKKFVKIVPSRLLLFINTDNKKLYCICLSLKNPS